MATLAELQDALRNADKAGDTAAARQLADAIVSMQETAAPPSTGDARRELIRREFTSFMSPLRGAKDILDTGAQGLAKLLGGREEAAKVKATSETEKAQYEQDTSGSMVAPVGRFAGRLAATAPVIGGVGRAVGTVAPRVGQAITAGGFSGAPLPVNVAGGAASGMLTAGLVDPESAAAGGLLGAALPAVGRVVSPAVDWVSKWLMQSAIKPTIKQLQTGDADTAVQTLLEKGLSPTKGGVEKLRGLIGEKNKEIASAIQGSTAQVNKFAAARPLSETARQFTRQVNPTDDLNAITKAGLDFLQHPAYPGTTIPVQAAQELKQGTYKILAKKYGQVGTAETEAQKALARGLKDEIAAAVPVVKGLNAEEARLLTTLDVAERRALMELNKNPMGLALLANNPGTWAAFIADRSAAFKALAARMLYSANRGAEMAAPAVGRSSGLLGVE